MIRSRAAAVALPAVAAAAAGAVTRLQAWNDDATHLRACLATLDRGAAAQRALAILEERAAACMLRPACN